MYLLMVFLVMGYTVLAQEQAAPKPVAPYSQSVMTGSGMLFVSGQIPMNPETGKLVDGDVGEATRQAMKNIGTILKKNIMDYSNIVKCTVFLTDIKDYAAMNEVYKTFFQEGFPAREAIQVVALPLNAKIEISAIAAKEVGERYTGNR